MQLNPAEISDLIKAKIENLSVNAEVRTRGTVVSVTDGIVRIHGLSDAMQGEMLEFPGNTFGLAMNLERDSVGAVVLGEYEHIKEGDTVTCPAVFWKCRSVANWLVAWLMHWVVLSMVKAQSIQH